MNMGYDSDDNSMCDVSVVVPCTKLLSKMSGGQAMKLKDLESIYEEVIDENCQVLVKYFKEVLENSNGNRLIMPPPLVILKEMGKVDTFDGNGDKKIIKEEPILENGRYNVMLHFFKNSFPH